MIIDRIKSSIHEFLIIVIVDRMLSYEHCVLIGKPFILDRKIS